MFVRARTQATDFLPLGRNPGFARPDLLISAALALMILAIVVPEFVLHGERQGFMAILWVAGGIVAIAVLFAAAVWLLDGGTGRKGGWGDRLSHAIRFLLRGILFGLMASILATALVSGHGLGVRRVDQVSLGAGLAGGLVGSLLHARLGPSRFWACFSRFCIALGGSLVLGILGLLVPGAWGPDAGILLPLLVFVVFALAGRIVPPRPKDPSPELP
jgi:hypothetical protein